LDEQNSKKDQFLVWGRKAKNKREQKKIQIREGVETTQYYNIDP
jgi:hypothetical protein